MAAPSRLPEHTRHPLPRQRRLRDLKSVPVLPSLITLGNLYFGFLAMAKVVDAVGIAGFADPQAERVIAAFESAALLVFVAMIFDALDGWVARMTGQTSAFGAQLDSLADLLTFGVAPAFIAKILINFHDRAPMQLLPAHPKIYYFCAAIFVLCAAMRLARFNVEAGPAVRDHEEFRGLPTPGAAAVICAIVAFHCSRNQTDAFISRMLLPERFHDWLIMAMPATLVCVGLLMVSRVPYPHMFYTMLRRRHSFPFLATLVVLIGLASVEWQLALLVLTVSYLAFGVGLGCFRLLTTGSMDPPPADDDVGGADDVGPGGGSSRAAPLDPKLN